MVGDMGEPGAVRWARFGAPNESCSWSHGIPSGSPEARSSLPCLALLYRWTSKIGMGASLEIPLGARLTMSSFLEAVRREPLRVPRIIPKVGGEIFRVDAKAEGSTVVIGGWVCQGRAVQGDRFFGAPGNHGSDHSFQSRCDVDGDCRKVGSHCLH